MSKDIFTSDYVSASTYEHLLAGSATTSFTLSSILYLESGHPEVEKKLVEIDGFREHDLVPTADDLENKFPYLDQILHVSDVEVRETKLMGDSPIIIVAFQTQQIYCVRNRQGLVTAGGKDTIHTVYYAWAMQQVEPEELGKGAFYPIWRLMEMQQLGVQSLI